MGNELDVKQVPPPGFAVVAREAALQWEKRSLLPFVVTADDGHEISDDARNFHGGDPGSYYGTEFALQLEWTIADFFTWTIEAAYLLPGDALQDIHGDAVPAYLVENRFVFAF